MASKYIECIAYHSRPKSTKRRKLSGKANAKLRKYFSAKTHATVTETDFVCDNCRQYFYRQSGKQVCLDSQDETDENNDTGPKISPKAITVKILTRGGSRKKCLICPDKNRKLVLIPTNARTQVLIEKGIIIADGSHCCKHHNRKHAW